MVWNSYIFNLLIYTLYTQTAERSCYDISIKSQPKRNGKQNHPFPDSSDQPDWSRNFFFRGRYHLIQIRDSGLWLRTRKYGWYFFHRKRTLILPRYFCPWQYIVPGMYFYDPCICFAAVLCMIHVTICFLSLWTNLCLMPARPHHLWLLQMQDNKNGNVKICGCRANCGVFKSLTSYIPRYF